MIGIPVKNNNKRGKKQLQNKGYAEREIMQVYRTFKNKNNYDKSEYHVQRGVNKINL